MDTLKIFFVYIELWFDFFSGWDFMILGKWIYNFIGTYKTSIFLDYMKYKNKSIRCTKLVANLDTILGLKFRQENLEKLGGFWN